MNTPNLSPPFRPLPIRALNAAGRALRHVGVRGFRLDETSLLATASRRARLEDFGEESFRPGFRRLLESLEADAELNLFGRYFAQRQVLELLTHRLRLAEHRTRYPEVAEERIDRPLFVMGLPRTGTTLLYSLLALDPAHRSPLSWEVDEPCPPPETATYASDERIERTQARFDQLKQLAPDMQAIHPVGALLPQECIVITAIEFYSIRFEMCFNISGYQEWFLNQDMRPAYAFHRRFLQHLQSRCPGERWVLKSPGHLGPVDALLAEYPDAMLVQTHRDPLSVIPSVSSLEYSIRGVSSDAVDPIELGRQQLRSWSALLDQGMAARERAAGKSSQFFDIHFREILEDPIACVRRIYAHFGVELSLVFENRMAEYVASHPRGEHGSHHYTLENFGLETETVRRAFKSYYERFGVEQEEGIPG